MTTIPAITLHQPWASWMAWGWKTIETRRHPRLGSLVGKRFAIHAGKHFDENALHIAAPYLSAEQQETAKRMDKLRAAGLSYPHGVVMCTAMGAGHDRLMPAYSKMALCPCTEIMYGLKVCEVKQLPPIPARGQQGIWHFTLPSL